MHRGENGEQSLYRKLSRKCASPARLCLLIFVATSLAWLVRSNALLQITQSQPNFTNFVYLPVIAKTSPRTGVFRGLFFGLGPEADQALQSPLAAGTKLKILSCWFNGTADLSFFHNWFTSGQIAAWWNQGYILHVITWEQPPVNQPAPYHVSPQFVQDMAQLGSYLSGPNDGRHAVLFSLATEFQTYIQPNNVYNSQTADYYNQLQSNLLLAREQIKAAAPNALVSFSWGGWQTEWDDPASGGGLSMIPFFAQTMKQMDFVSFQAMQTTYPTNVADIKRNTDVFSQYNPYLMVSHYRPDYDPNDPASIQQATATLDAEVQDIFTSSFIDYVYQRGLFAFSFMGDNLIHPPTTQTVINGINNYSIFP